MKLVASVVLISIASVIPQSLIALDSGTGCGITIRPQLRFVPPNPFPEIEEGAAKFYFGSEKLWTLLSEYAWTGVQSADGLEVKVPWFAAGLTREEQLNPHISVSARSLNRPNAGFKVDGPNNGFIKDYYFFPSELIFGDDGCWEITAKRKDAEIRFVVLVLRTR